MSYNKRLKNLQGFEDAFELVRTAVYDKYKMRRAGLNLLLQDMPNFIGAYHVLGSNFIVVNRYVLSAIKTMAQGKEEYNSYLFVVLAHEYLHSLGIVDEFKVRNLTYNMCNTLFGDAHVATRMAKEDPASLYPQLKKLMAAEFGKDFELIKNFDRSNMSYIG
ncbi:MAG: hypothetical protein ACE5KA_00630 [Nitrososphaerales archaeon]